MSQNWRQLTRRDSFQQLLKSHGCWQISMQFWWFILLSLFSFELNHDVDVFFLHCRHVDFVTTSWCFHVPRILRWGTGPPSSRLLRQVFFVFFLFRPTDQKSENKFENKRKKKRGWPYSESSRRVVDLPKKWDSAVNRVNNGRLSMILIDSCYGFVSSVLQSFEDIPSIHCFSSFLLIALSRRSFL